MNYIFTPFSYALLGATIVGLLVAVMGLRRRHAPGAVYLALMGLAVAVWAFAIVFEAAATSLDRKLLWSQIAYLGTAWAPLLYFLFAMAFSQADLWLTRRTLALLSVIPAITVVMVATNSWHSWFWPTIRIDPATNIASYGRGNWWWINFSYSYSLLFVGVFTLFRSLFRFPSVFRPQRNVLLAGSLAPVLGNLIYVLKLGPGLDWTPIGFSVSAAILAFGVFQYRLLDVNPIARDKLIERMGDGVLVLDHAQRLIDLNPAAQRLTGRELAQVVGQPLPAALPDWPDISAHLRDDEESRAEIRLGDEDDYRYYDLHTSPLHVEQAAVSGWLLVLRDMTAHKQREEALRAEKMKAQQYFETAGLVYVALDRQGDITLINKRGLEILGYEQAELIGRNWFETCVPERYRTESAAIYKRLLADGNFDPFEAYDNAILTNTGEEHTIAWRNTYLRDANGDVVGCLSSGRDVTEQKQVKQALQESERQYTELFERVPVGVYRSTPDGQILDANPAFVQMLRYPDLQTLLAVKAVDLFVNPGDRDRELALLDVEGVLDHFEMQIRRFDGEVIWVRDVCRPVKDAGGRILAFEGSLEDITERKRAEAHLRDYRDRLEVLVAERTSQLEKRLVEIEQLNRSVANILADERAANRQIRLTSRQLAEANKELESFVYSISHDLRAPLRHIDNFAQLLLKREQGKLGVTSARYLQNVVDAAGRMGELMDDLLVFSRTGLAEMNLRDVDSNKVLGQARAELAHLCENRRISWEIAQLPAVRGDPSLLRVVWSNLLSNAIKYSAPRPQARIEIGALPAEKKGQVTFFVRDNGVGFDPQYSHRLFGVFQRLHSPEAFAGNGIGLATVRHLVHRMGGRVWAEGTVDGGATFYFMLAEARNKNGAKIAESPEST